MSRLKAKAIRSPGFWVVCLAIVVAIAANINTNVLNQANGWANVQAPGPNSSDSSSSKDDLLVREDTRLTAIRGHVVLQNGRYEFLEEGTTKRVKILENLWLERIVDAQKSTTRKIVWSVNAVAKEFADENYLLIEAASKAR